MLPDAINPISLIQMGMVGVDKVVTGVVTGVATNIIVQKINEWRKEKKATPEQKIVMKTYDILNDCGLMPLCDEFFKEHYLAPDWDPIDPTKTRVELPTPEELSNDKTYLNPSEPTKNRTIDEELIMAYDSLYYAIDKSKDRQNRRVVFLLAFILKTILKKNLSQFELYYYTVQIKKATLQLTANPTDKTPGIMSKDSKTRAFLRDNQDKTNLVKWAIWGGFKKNNFSFQEYLDQSKDIYFRGLVKEICEPEKGFNRIENDLQACLKTMIPLMNGIHGIQNDKEVSVPKEEPFKEMVEVFLKKIINIKQVELENFDSDMNKIIKKHHKKKENKKEKAEYFQKIIISYFIILKSIENLRNIKEKIDDSDGDGSKIEKIKKMLEQIVNDMKKVQEQIDGFQNLHQMSSDSQSNLQDLNKKIKFCSQYLSFIHQTIREYEKLPTHKEDDEEKIDNDFKPDEKEDSGKNHKIDVIDEKSEEKDDESSLDETKSDETDQETISSKSAGAERINDEGRQALLHLYTPIAISKTAHRITLSANNQNRPSPSQEEPAEQKEMLLAVQMMVSGPFKRVLDPNQKKINLNDLKEFVSFMIFDEGSVNKEMEKIKEIAELVKNLEGPGKELNEMLSREPADIKKIIEKTMDACEQILNLPKTESLPKALKESQFLKNLNQYYERNKKSQGSNGKEICSYFIWSEMILSILPPERNQEIAESAFMKEKYRGWQIEKSKKEEEIKEEQEIKFQAEQDQKPGSGKKEKEQARYDALANQVSQEEQVQLGEEKEPGKKNESFLMKVDDIISSARKDEKADVYQQILDLACNEDPDYWTTENVAAFQTKIKTLMQTDCHQNKSMFKTKEGKPVSQDALKTLLTDKAWQEPDPPKSWIQKTKETDSLTQQMNEKWRIFSLKKGFKQMSQKVKGGLTHFEIKTTKGPVDYTMSNNATKCLLLAFCSHQDFLSRLDALKPKRSFAPRK